MPRQERKKKTPEEIEKQNEWMAVRRLELLIANNFYCGDYHITWTFEKNEKPQSFEELIDIGQKFVRKARDAYKRSKKELKYIWVPEKGKRGNNFHIHMIVNDWVDGGMTGIKLLRCVWKKMGYHGRPKMTPLDPEKSYKDLAEYLVKETMQTVKETGSPLKQRYKASRNLEKPKTKKKIMRRPTWKDAYIKKGYVLDKSTYREGINKFTGYAYRYYTLVKLIPTGKIRC